MIQTLFFSLVATKKGGPVSGDHLFVALQPTSLFGALFVVAGILGLGAAQ